MIDIERLEKLAQIKEYLKNIPESGASYRTDMEWLIKAHEDMKECLKFYADRMNYSIDHDTSQMGTSRRVILYSDQEEINEATIIAGRLARACLSRIEVVE